MSELGEVNKYSNASIYTIRNYKDDTLIYVGSTISPIHKRLCSHKANCRNGRSGSLYSHIIDNDWSDWYLELYERFPCNDRAELCKREGEVIREIGTINKQIAGRTHKEYFQDNHEKQLARMKEWRENNPEYRRKWYDDNREKELARRKEWYNNNRDKQLARVKNWQANNRDKHLEDMRNWRANNSERIREYNARKKLGNSLIIQKLTSI